MLNLLMGPFYGAMACISKTRFADLIPESVARVYSALFFDGSVYGPMARESEV